VGDWQKEVGNYCSGLIIDLSILTRVHLSCNSRVIWC